MTVAARSDDALFHEALIFEELEPIDAPDFAEWAMGVSIGCWVAGNAIGGGIVVAAILT